MLWVVSLWIYGENLLYEMMLLCFIDYIWLDGIEREIKGEATTQVS